MKENTINTTNLTSNSTLANIITKNQSLGQTDAFCQHVEEEMNQIDTERRQETIE
jgi:hypothetical protein